ncbi:MAG: lipopolysaccharide biosynthesis protein, partial [Mediterranea sp.]|nr:lipopolysaccharide biosynthesis protein [Mediterranea sp.]
KSETLKEKTAKGLFWGGLSNGVQQLLNLVFGIFLARILDANDYGMVGMLAIFSQIAASLQESGFTIAIANKKEVDHEDYNAVFWFSTFTGSILYIILFFCAPLIADFYDEPALTLLAHYSFLGFFISSLGTAQHAYLFRNLKVKQKVFALMLSLALSGIIGITLALSGLAYWALATQSLVYISSLTICYWCFSPWRPTLQINFKPLQSMIGFSSKLLITNIFTHLNSNLLSVLLGRFYSEKAVGYFNQASNWNMRGYSFISEMLQGVAQPILVQVKEDKERQRYIFRKMLRFTAFVSFPVMLGLSLISKELIIITITEKWLFAASILQILCVGGAFYPIVRLYTNLIISKGWSGAYMWNTIAICLVQLAAMLISYPWGILTMAGIYTCINIAWLLIWHYFAWHAISIKLWDALKDVAPYLVITAAIMLLTGWITSYIDNIYAVIIAKICIAALLYTGIMWLTNSVIFKESIAFILKKKK